MGDECWSNAYRNFKPRVETVSPKCGREIKRSEFSGSDFILNIRKFRMV